MQIQIVTPDEDVKKVDTPLVSVEALVLGEISNSDDEASVKDVTSLDVHELTSRDGC